MNDTQLYLTIGIPTVTVILAWLSNKSDMTSLRAEVKADNNALRAEMINLRKEIYEALIPCTSAWRSSKSSRSNFCNSASS